VRERVGRVAEIVKVVPLAVPATAGAPGGIAFALVVLTTASDEALAEAAGVAPSAVRTVSAAAAVAPAPAEEAPADLPEPDERDPEGPRRGAVRVAVGRLDEAMEALAALLVSRARLAREVAAMAARGVDVRELGFTLQDDARRVRDLRAAILRVRMVPVAEALARVQLVVRSLRRGGGKLVRLEVDAGQAECDKSVADQLLPAVVHLVRNAVDHAVEAPAERRAAGKPEESVVRIGCAARSSTQLELTVTDDGRGVDRERVAARARRPAPATDAALLDLLCLPGLSTQAQASTTSGRGMGMDIVRRIVVDDLGGELLLRTARGAGTTFTLRVPLTLAVLDAFAFECAGQRYAVALSSVDEVIEVDPAGVTRGPSPRAPGVVGMVERRGAALPVVDLDAVLGLGGRREPARRALVVRRGGDAMAFAVDRMLGQQEVVVRPLEDPLLKFAGVSGATDLGDGRATLVLDLGALRLRLSRAAPEGLVA
jgi:two-component system chemotaxis sensor kinase CheA